MKIKCKSCGKGFNIPDERLPKDKEISFPCPACKVTISIDLRLKAAGDNTVEPEEGQENRLTGEALKNRILRNVMDLPPMPQTVIKAREIMDNPKSDFKELADLFETDQAIATKILKLANSPYYGMSGKVSSIQHASVVLGQKVLGELITMGGTSSLLSGELEGYGLDAGALWKHSLCVAFGSRIIANRIEPALSNDAFTSGLIHDSGKLILDKYIRERWELFEEYMSDGPKTFLDAERVILELDHSEVASAVCKTWNIPAPLTVAIRYHHYPSNSHGDKLTYIVHVADAIALMTGLGVGVDGTLYKMDEQALGFLRLNESDIGDVMGEVIIAAKKILE